MLLFWEKIGHKKKTYILCLVISLPLIIIAGLLLTDIEKINATILSVSFLRCEGRTDCIEQVFERVAQQHGMHSAAQSFFTFLNTQKVDYPMCHLYAHSVGHAVRYIYHEDIQENNFDFADLPEEFFLCVGGALHGLADHMDNTDWSATEICEHLKVIAPKNITNKKRIGEQCYHSFSHMFLNINAQSTSHEKWGSFEMFFGVPIMKCERLENITETEKAECMDAIFTFAIDTVKSNKYGFSYDTHDLSELCPLLDVRWHNRCFVKMLAETAELSDINTSVIKNKTALILDENEKRKLAQELISYAITTLSKQKNIKAYDEYSYMLGQCQSFSNILYESCILIIVKALFNVSVAIGHRSAMILCEEPIVLQDGFRLYCYEQIIKRMYNSYPAERARSACKDFPMDVRKACVGQYRVTSLLEL